MTENEQKQHLALKLITALRDKLHKKTDNESEKDMISKNNFPSPKDVAAIFDNLQDKWKDKEAEKSVLYQFIDEWVAANNKKD